MTDTTTTTSPSENIETSLKELESYFGVDNLDLEDFQDMTTDERIAYLESLLEKKLANEGKDIEEISIDDLSDFENSLDDLHALINKSIGEIQFMMSEGGKVEDIAKWELLLVELEELDDLTTGDNNLYESLETAFDDVASKHKTVENGDTEPVDLTNAKDGDVFEYTAEEVTDSSESIHNTEENADWLDVDGSNDGYKEYNPDEDGDGVIDDPEYLMEKIGDRDSDGFFTQADIDIHQNKSDTTLSFPVEDIDSAYIRSVDGDTVEWVLTLKNGGKVVVKATGFDKFLLPVELTNAESVHVNTLAKIQENANSANTLHWFTYGTELTDPNASTFAYAYTKDSDNKATVKPTDEDFQNGTNFTITAQPGVADAIEVDLSDYDNAEVSFSEDADGNLVMTVTHDEDEFTITFIGLEYSTDVEKSDMINITGGTINYSTKHVLDEIIIPGATNSEPEMDGILSSMITHDEELLAITHDMSEEANNLSVNLTSEDFEYNQDIIVNFAGGTPDSLNLDIPNNAEVFFDSDDDGNLVLRIESPDGTCTITCVGMEYSKGSEADSDNIYITGGSINTEESNWDALNALAPKDYDNRGETIESGYFIIIYHDGNLMANIAVVDNGYSGLGM